MVKGRLGSVKTRKSYSSHNLVTKTPQGVSRYRVNGRSIRR